MQTTLAPSAKKGRLSLSIRQDILDRLEPFKNEINLSSQTEQLLLQLVERLENQDWAKRNAAALASYGQAIAQTGVAGSEFDRV